MTVYRISSVTSGAALGEYEGETASEAVAALHLDAGYGSTAEAAAALGLTVEAALDDLVVEEVDRATARAADLDARAAEHDARRAAERRVTAARYAPSGAADLPAALDAVAYFDRRDAVAYFDRLDAARADAARAAAAELAARAAERAAEDLRDAKRRVTAARAAYWVAGDPDPEHGHGDDARDDAGDVLQSAEADVAYFAARARATA